MGRSKKRQQPERSDGQPEGAPDEASRDSGEGGRGSVLRAVLIFGGVMGLFYGVVEFFDLPSWGPFQAYLNFIAAVTGKTLALFGTEVEVIDNVVQQGQFRVKVVRGCDALEPSAAFIAAVLASPVAFKMKLPGVLIGTLTILFLNLVRVISLFLIGIHARSIFDMMHYDVWQAAFIVLAILFWAIWVQWATKPKLQVSHA